MKRLVMSLICRLIDHRLQLTHTAANLLWEWKWGQKWVTDATIKCRRCGRMWYL